MSWKEKTLINTCHDPWKHYIVDNFLPKDLYTFVKTYPIHKHDGFKTGITNAGHTNSERCFINKHSKFYKLKNWFDERFLVPGTTLRGEISKNSITHPHSDDHLRKVTIVVTINRTSDSIEGTYLYDKDINLKKIVPWKNNRAVIFYPIEDITFHSSQRELDFNQERRTLIVSYVTPEGWKDKHQLWDVQG